MWPERHRQGAQLVGAGDRDPQHPVDREHQDEYAQHGHRDHQEQPRVATEDADATTAAIEKAGGTILSPAMDVGDFGRMAIAQVPGGGAFGYWQANSHTGFQVSRKRKPTITKLKTGKRLINRI